jgi:hypothetical protein
VNGLDATNAFFELISSEIAPRLTAEASAQLSHWMIVSDAEGVVVCRLDDDTEGMPADSVLASHVSEGATAAAFLTVRDGFVLAQALIREPRNSDLRRALLTDVSGELQLGPWIPEF